MFCIWTIFFKQCSKWLKNICHVKFDFFIISVFGNFVKQNSYRIKKKLPGMCNTLFSTQFKFFFKNQNVPKFKYFECCITKFLQKNRIVQPPPPIPFPQPHPKCKNCFSTTYQWKTVGISIHIFCYFVFKYNLCCEFIAKQCYTFTCFNKMQ